MELEILEERREKNILYITAEIKLRKFCRDKRVICGDRDVIQALEEDYDIVSVAKSNTISNSMRGGYKQVGTWIFTLKPQRKRSTSRKPSTKKSFRGRITNIAKKIESERKESVTE